MGSKMVIAGLGNPGFKYRHTRHNAGFDAIDVIAKHYGVSIKKKARKALYAEVTTEGKQLILIKPQTYMNNSGESIADWVHFYGLEATKDLIVLSDDVTMDCGMIRIRKKGSAGGHNGLKSIIRDLGTQDFMRVRIGVGQLESGDDMIGHVLRKPMRADRKELEKAYVNCMGAVSLMIRGEVDRAMNDYNAKKRK